VDVGKQRAMVSRQPFDQLRTGGQKSEVRVKLMSDLRLLTSVIDDLNGFNDLPLFLVTDVLNSKKRVGGNHARCTGDHSIEKGHFGPASLHHTLSFSV
jgi:hypothetical protein